MSKTTIEGHVTDQSGEPIPGAMISLTAQSGKVQRVEANEKGKYIIIVTKSGSYQLTFQFEGFNTVVREVFVKINAHETINVTMSVSN
jgi:protocatechuate 3,4-dioxygenase beta subunit